MIRTVFWVTWVFWYMAVRMPMYLWARWQQKYGDPAKAQALMDKHGPLWAKRLFKHIKVNIHVEGRENLPQNGETVLFVSNHQSYVDIPVFLSDLGGPHPLMAKKELSKVPFLSSWMRLLGCVFVERDDVRAAMKALKEAEAVLKSGKSMIICPEGTRSKSDEMAEFKGGSVRMAFSTGVPIIPLAIDGSYKVLEGNHYHIQSADIRLLILPRVEVAGLSRAEQKELPQKLHDMIKEAKDTPQK